MKSVCVVAVYTNYLLMLLSCWPGMYWVCVCVELRNLAGCWLQAP